MELEEFKELYNLSIDKQNVEVQDPLAIAQNTSKGPLAKLEKSIRFALYLNPAFMVFMAAVYALAIGLHDLVHNPILMLMFIIFLSEFILSAINYLTIKKMRSHMGNVRATLQYNVTLLKVRYKWYLVINTVLFLLMPAYLEFEHASGSLPGLSKINVFIRIAWYALIFGGMFVIKKEAQRQQYDTYLDELNILLQEIE